MAKNTTKYTVRIDGVDTDFTRSKKETVVAEATRRLKAKEGYKVEVVTQAGNVVFTAARRKITKVTKPYTKTIELPEDLATAVPEGYAAAYARYRNGAVVLRREADIEDDDSRYAVLNVLTRTIAGYAETTRGAGQIMKGLGADRKAAKASA